MIKKIAFSRTQACACPQHWLWLRESSGLLGVQFGTRDTYSNYCKLMSEVAFIILWLFWIHVLSCSILKNALFDLLEGYAKVVFYYFFNLFIDNILFSFEISDSLKPAALILLLRVSSYMSVLEIVKKLMIFQNRV